MWVLFDFSVTARSQGEMFVYKVSWLREVCWGKMQRKERESVRIVMIWGIGYEKAFLWKVGFPATFL